MGFLDRFNRNSAHRKKLSSAYGTFKPDTVEIVFPGKAEQADKVIVSLSKIFNISLDDLDAKDYLEFLYIYMEIKLRKVIIPESDDEIINWLQVNHGKFVKSPAIAKDIIAYASLNILNHNFAIESQADFNLLSSNIVADFEKADTAQEGQCVKVGFYFENTVELAIYVKHLAKNRLVTWLGADLYISQYKRAYQLVEEEKYAEAIAVLNACLKINPIGISARFEMCECYIRLSNLNTAKKILLDMSAYLIEPKHIARFYRRIGFIEIENENYLAAAACFVYSRNFENHPGAVLELQYIGEKFGISLNNYMDSRIILKKYGIPILVERGVEDIQM